MLKKLMSSIVIGSIVLSMVGCTATNESDKQQAEDIINSTKQEQQVELKEKEVKKEQEQPKEHPKEQQQSKPKESKKKQNDNIDPGTGLAKVKDGTHLGEEADKQDKQNEDYDIWNKDYCPECGKPAFNCICDGDTDADIDNSTTTIYEHKNVVPDELQGDDYKELECPDCGQPLSKCPFNGGHTTVEENK